MNASHIPSGLAGSVPASVQHGSAVPPSIVFPPPLERAFRPIGNQAAKVDSNWIITACEAEARGNPSTLVDKLRHSVETLAAELNRLRGVGAKPQEGAAFLRLPLGDSEALVEFEYSPGTPSQTSGPPERCYEGDPEELTILGVLVNGTFVEVEVFDPEVVERWEEAIRDSYAEQRENDMADRADRERDYV